MSRFNLIRIYIFWLVLLIGTVQSQFDDEGSGGVCPEFDAGRECPPIDAIVNTCLVDSDCAEDELCCSDGCQLGCARARRSIGDNTEDTSETEVCAVPVDLGFVIDASGSIGPKNFKKILDFVAKIIDAFDVREDGTHIGVIFYSDNATLAFDFSKFQGAELNRDNVVKEINKISVTSGQTRIDLALTLAKDKLFSVEGGARPNKPKIALVMTDGRQTRGEDAPDAIDLHIASRPLKNMGVQVYSLGIGSNYDIGELLDIASDDASVFRSQDVDELVSIVASITEQTCKGCTRAVDIHFALDASQNVGRENFQVIKNFIKAIGFKFIISETGSHMSASIFGEYGTLIFSMDQATQQEDFINEVDNVPYIGDFNGNIDKALDMVSEDIFTFDGFSRQGVPKVLVVLTASNCDSCEKSVEEAVKPLKAQGVHVVAIPIGSNANMEEMDKMASYPTQDYVIPRASYEELLNGVFIQKVSEMVCSGRPGVCEEPPIEGECTEIINECTLDVNCPANRKCCIKDCKASCEVPAAACITPIDLAFAFETTGFIEENFDEVKSFASSLLDHFRVEPAKTHISISTYGESVNAKTAFYESYDKSALKQFIKDLEPDGGRQANIGDFLKTANEEIFNITNGIRQSSPRMLVLFTNGVYSNDQIAKAQEESLKLKAEGQDVNILVINIGSIVEGNSVLRDVVSTPDFRNLHNVTDLRRLVNFGFENKIAEAICASKVRKTRCKPRTPQACSVRDDLCQTDFDCPGYQECYSDGCRLRCQTCENRCGDKVDLLFMIDTSSRIGPEGFKNAKENIKKMLEWFTIEANNTNVAAITYSDNANYAMQLPAAGSNDPPQTLFDVQGRLDSIPYSGGSKSNLDKALKMAAAQVFYQNSLRLRKDSKKAIVIVTDGVDDSTSRLEIASWPLRKQRVVVDGNDYAAIRLLAVTVGNNYNLDTLEKVVSPPIDKNIFLAADFDDMYNGIRQLAEDSCKYTRQDVEPPVIAVKGDPGPKGEKGRQGNPGTNGTDGMDGIEGPKGERGDDGPKGEKGDTGIAGPPGGDQGDLKGPDPMAEAVGIIEGTAVKGTRGVTYDLRDGPIGPPGPIGGVGKTGLPGDSGEQGQKGRGGPPGLRGVFGGQGPKGNPGEDASPGLPGEPGPKGISGKKGPTGSPGMPGPQGPFGYKGEQGIIGQPGDPGDGGKKGPKGYAGEKGDQGDIGDAGFPGPDGKVGPIGPPGQRGLRGPEGSSGPIGKTGDIGNKGLPGPRGSRGLKGQSGNAGPRGGKGRTGDVGLVGEKGTQGSIGEAGQEGQPGVPGKEGPPGYPGPIGTPGPMGSRGDIGPQGEEGPKGSLGLKGNRGEAGRRGLTGEKGETGDIGELGPKGAQGQQGKQGKTGKIGPRGQQGPLGFQGLQGQTGDPGQNGRQGPKGNLGPTGEKGADGPKGSLGSAGLTGPKGLVGEPGNVGRPGLPGRDGKNGPQGANGKDGDPGASGPQGLQGSPGSMGTPGSTGDPGSPGDRGATGAVGDKGTRGDSGVRGEPGAFGQQGPPGLRGERGEKGPQGTNGVQGSPGPRGTPGLEGLDGIVGRKGTAGRPGNPGQSGEQGAVGSIGVPGPQGISGTPGERGDGGSDGGPGEQGPPGLQGSSGSPGRDGMPGRPGQQGTTGGKGKTGLRGPKGANGQNGVQGARGPDGLPGAPGLVGNRGTPGPNGIPGLDGNPGPAGKQGKQGKMGTPGMSGPVGLRGPVGSPGLRGQKGPTGDRGDSGETGPIGVAGDIGPRGFTGELGLRGAIGEMGQIGETGPQGMPGSQGTPGAAGLTGPAGPSGLPGKDGNKGPIGDPGNAGNPGRDGGPGSPGKDGTPGEPGTPGSQGKQGLKGPFGPQGAPGEQGQRGLTGRQGSGGKDGPKGFPGNDGSPGISGKRGPRGKDGTPGSPGPIGKDGRPGKPGINGTDGDPGNNGPKGDPGERGDSGDSGSLGASGDKGKTGSEGPAGFVGPRGSNGKAGVPGKRGKRGDQGRDGPRGNSGPDGIDGSKGFKGNMGRFGIQGPPGDAGLKGALGPDGTVGHTGPQGNTGDPGPDGPEGPSGSKGPAGNAGQIGNAGYPGSPGDGGIPGTAGLPGPPGPPGPPGDMSGAFSGNYWDFVNAGGLQKGPRYYGGRSKRSLDQQDNSIEKVFKSNYETFKNFDTVWNQIVDDLVIQKTLGSSKNPALTCGDLFKTNPITKSGDYWIDPNEGSPDDAILVHCNATNYETCIYPRWPSFEKDNWYEGEEDYLWAYKDRLLSDEEYISYSADIVQLNMIRLMSEKVRQNITYHCKNSFSDIQIKTDDNKVMRIDKPSKMTIIKRDDCLIKDDKWRRAIFEMKSKYLELFPLQDLAFNDIAGYNEEFGLDIGPVCFS